MKNIKQFLLSRKIVLTLIVLIFATVVLGYIFPQKFTSSGEQLEKWREAYPYMVPWVNRLGLDHVYTTPWFAALLACFLLTLIFSTVEQAKLSYRRTFGPGFVPDSEGVTVSLDREGIIKAVGKAGYFLSYKDDSAVRFIRHPYGYWGNVLLHSGIAVAILASLMIVATEKRGLVHLVEGETFSPEVNGSLRRPVLREAVLFYPRRSG